MGGINVFRILLQLSVLIFLSAILLGCIHTPSPRLAVFNEAEYAPYVGEGTVSIYGDAFLKTRGGDVKKGAGNEVFLNPVTSYSTEWFERTIIGGQPLEAADPRALKYHRKTRADGDGKFEFEKLPPGEYYLACFISWEIPGPYGSAQSTGGWVYAKVKLVPGERKKVVLTR